VRLHILDVTSGVSAHSEARAPPLAVLHLCCSGPQRWAPGVNGVKLAPTAAPAGVVFEAERAGGGAHEGGAADVHPPSGGGSAAAASPESAGAGGGAAAARGERPPRRRAAGSAGAPCGPSPACLVLHASS